MSATEARTAATTHTLETRQPSRSSPSSPPRRAFVDCAPRASSGANRTRRWTHHLSRLLHPHCRGIASLAPGRTLQTPMSQETATDAVTASLTADKPSGAGHCRQHRQSPAACLPLLPSRHRCLVSAHQSRPPHRRQLPLTHPSCPPCPQPHHSCADSATAPRQRSA